MTLSEVVEFILPQENDPIQIVFLFVILAMMIGTIFCAYKYANEISWEKKWNRGTPNDHSDDLDIEHGSVTDLSHAVATAPEKVAEIMPGMLLVIGLLGTFLGLGLALNKASSILGQANAMSVDGAADSMNHLMGLLQGLGTKFKTSTWGITGFVVLKIWSEAMRYDEKRLAWVIAKVKKEIEKRKLEKINQDKENRSQLYFEINSASEKISKTINEQIKLQTNVNKAIHEKSTKLEESKILILNDLKVDMAATKSTMEIFTQRTESVVDKMASAAEQMAAGAIRIDQAAERMALGADKVGVAGQDLVAAIDEFKSQFSVVLEDVRRDLGAAILDMSTQAANTLESGSKQLSLATSEISVALHTLSSDVRETMTEVQSSIQNALDIQKKTSMQFSSMASSLDESITQTTNIVGKLAEPIENGLTAVSASNRELANFGRRFDASLKVLGEVIEKLDELSEVLMPIQKIPDTHLNIVEEIQGLRKDIKFPSSGVMPENKSLSAAG